MKALFVSAAAELGNSHEAVAELGGSDGAATAAF